MEFKGKIKFSTDFNDIAIENLRRYWNNLYIENQQFKIKIIFM